MKPTTWQGRAAAVLAVAVLAVGAVWGGSRLLGDDAREGSPVEDPEARGAADPTEDLDPTDGDMGGEPSPPESPPATGDPGPADDDTGNDVTFDTLPDGEHFGFVSSFTGEAITFSPAEFLSGDEALAAAREDGMIGPGQDLPNPFYIRGPDTGDVTLAVGEAFEAAMFESVRVPPRELDAATMAALYAGEADAGWVYSLLDWLPMDLVVEDGEVVRADQRYVP